LLGITSIGTDWEVLKAVNPYYRTSCWRVSGRFWLLGAVFLYYAAALYSDLGAPDAISGQLDFCKILPAVITSARGAWLLMQGKTLTAKVRSF